MGTVFQFAAEPSTGSLCSLMLYTLIYAVVVVVVCKSAAINLWYFRNNYLRN